MTYYGVDVSHHNTDDKPPIDWSAVRGNNISFASVKATESTDYTDPAVSGQVNGARSVGLAAGGYHFARDADPVAQANHFAAALNGNGLLGVGSLWPMLDMEAPELRSNADAFIQRFITAFRQRTGQVGVLVYANLDWFTHVLHPDQWADDAVRLWIARYNGDPGNPGWSHPKLALHQHSSTGAVPGISGNVDRDATVPGVALSGLLIGNTAVPAPVPPPMPDTYTVRSGDTLSGIAANHGTTWPELARINGLADPNRIYPGQVLRLHGDPTNAVPTYTIRAGDTLSAIGSRVGVSWQALSRINNLANPNRIYPGQVLRLR